MYIYLSIYRFIYLCIYVSMYLSIFTYINIYIDISTSPRRAPPRVRGGARRPRASRAPVTYAHRSAQLAFTLPVAPCSTKCDPTAEETRAVPTKCALGTAVSEREREWQREGGRAAAGGWEGGQGGWGWEGGKNLAGECDALHPACGCVRQYLWVQGFWFRVWWLRFRVWGLRFQISDFSFWFLG